MENFNIWLARAILKGTRRHFSALHAEYLQEKRASMSDNPSNDLMVPQNTPAREDGANLIQPPTPHQTIGNVVARRVDSSDADKR